MNEEKFMAKNHCLKEFSENQTLYFKIRSFICEKFGIRNIWDLLPYKYSMWYYDYLTPIFKPKNSRLRKAIPRQWRDISSLIVDVNFEFIKAFYEDEFIDGVVDWSATEHHMEFSLWLEESYLYITKERPELEKQKEDSYPKMAAFDKMFEEIIDQNGQKLYQFKDDGIPYDVKYKEVNRLEKLIEEKDTDILIQIIKRREYFWT